MKDRYRNLARIRSLDPSRDHVAIYQTTVRYEFPWDMRMGLNLAFIRTFSMPEVAAILVGTGELTDRTQRRLDDTGLLMYEIVLHGFDHERGRAAIRRINQLHRPYRDVPADEFRYVLACLMVVPMRWLDRYGWRRPCCHEREASYRFYRELGERMNIPDIPGSLPELERWFDAYDRAHLRPDPHAAAIERATRMRMLARLPRALAPLGDPLVGALYDAPLRAATGVPAPVRPVSAALHLVMRGRALATRHLARPREVGLFEDGIVTRSHPHGYEISRLGPP
ncbi:oxygenase MpaB family protein [Asanoa siamensis]|uniref:Peptidase n=1 Tax=Asanoa siamensis TaxID=926357 RepID=A0ABQ4D3M7_9ACTN|nr:oxygenase MpaB family protein [Asanoa siamensis]GIF78148.1 peptidase [Asanoa siamensis]